MADGSTYPRPNLPEDSTELRRRAWAVLQSRMPGYEPGAGAGDWLIEATTLSAEATVTALNRWSEFAFARLGELDGAPLLQGSPARAASTWTFNDTGAYTVRRGTPVRLITSDGEVEMVVVGDVEKPAGLLATAVGEVLLETLETGAAFNDLTGTLILDEPVRELAADGLVLEGVTVGGSDIEDLESYLGRLTRRRRLQTPRPVRADEFAVFLLEQVDVGRVTILDLYNPVTGDTDARAATTAFVASPTGEPLLDGRTEQLEALLRDLVEVNYDAFVRDPSYTFVDVTATGRSLPGYDPTVTAARLKQSIRQHLDPALFGIPKFGDQPFAALPQTTIGYLDLAADAGATEGLDRLTDLQLAATGDPLGTADVLLDGPAPLPRAGTITVTVT